MGSRERKWVVAAESPWKQLQDQMQDCVLVPGLEQVVKQADGEQCLDRSEWPMSHHRTHQLYDPKADHLTSP